MALIFSTYEFTAFDELEKSMDSNKDISIIALCIDMKPKRLIQTRSGNQTYVQDIILINKSFQTMMLTMWDSYVDRECVLIAENIANKPVIVASHLKVSSFNGITLSTKTNSNFFINATFNEVAEYKAWVSNANLGETYQCVYCKCSQTKAVPRAKVYVQLEDSTGVLNANVIGEPAEKLLHCSSETLMQHSKRSTTNIHDAIQMAVDKEQIFYVKATQGLINKTEYKFKIIFVLDTCLVITQIEHSKVDKGKGLLYPDLPTEPTLIEEVCSSY
ncbi:Replication factor A protein [Abeliophyllum distichum]|uniref:Replication factor A protein n=1 Tax=Abeliophyllum distichum TaxID=126358 RepID=A0ABD1NVM0_9LAMI